MWRFCGAARAAPLATRAFPLRAITGRTLSTMPAKPVRLDPQLESVLARFKKGGSNEKEGAARLVEDFERLQSRKVMRVLLVCSDYDSYTWGGETANDICPRGASPDVGRDVCLPGRRSLRTTQK